MSAAAKLLIDRIQAIDTAATNNRQRVETYQRMTDELKAVEIRATSPDGMVTVVAGPGGAVTAITFSEAIRDTTPSALSAAVLSVLAEARALAARRQADVIRQGLGDTELLDRVLDSDSQLFGDPRPVAPPTGPVPSARCQSSPPVDDDYYQDFNVLKQGSGR
jgi:DNA-binding protein YbaB